MFPNQKTGILSFEPTNNQGGQNVENNEQVDKILMDYGLYGGGALLDGVGALNPSNNTSNCGRGRKSSTNITNNVATSSSHGNKNVDDDEQKKIVHREIERQRRLEMSHLCASLRSILPADYIKGKRSTSDHLGEAVNYIKDLEKNVKDLGDKRDQLKTSLLESSGSKHEAGVGGSSRNSDTLSPGTVVMIPSLVGLEIEINVSYDNQDFSLSTALQVILDEGLGIASCTSTKVDDRLVHIIVSEAGDMTCINIDELHQRLIYLLC